MLKPSDPALQPPEPGSERPVGELVNQLVEDGKAYARAELGVAKAIASAKADALKVPAILLGAAVLILQAAVTMLAAGLFFALLEPLGPLLAGLLAALVFAAIAGGLAWWAVTTIRRAL